MADNIESLDLTFDVKSFQLSVEKMTDSFNKFSKDVENTDKKRNNNIMKNSRNMAQATAKGFINAFGKIAMLGGALFAVYRGLSAIVRGIPEIGQSFKVASDVFLNSLLAPLKSLLLPMLKRFTAWVQNNRALFTEWGTVLANVFKLIFVTINSVFKIIKSMFSGFMETINKLYKNSIGNMTDFINMILFKIAMIIAFVGAKLEPLMKIIGEIFAKVVKNIMDFAKGFVEGFIIISSKLGIMENLKNILSEISKIMELLNPAMKLLGFIIGTVIAVAFKGILATVELILKGINSIGEFFAKDGTKEVKVIREERFTPKKENILSSENVKRVNDVILRPNGEIIKTNPMDTILAIKKPEKLSKNKSNEITLNFSNVFNISGNENLKNKVENISVNLMEQIRKGLLNEYVLQGNR